MPDDSKPTPGAGVYGTMQLPPGTRPEDLPASAIDATIRPASGDSLPSFAPPPVPEPDTRYELGAEIARGGMGRVVDATDTVLGRTVAFKEALSNDPDALRRFARETRITARLEHPSIVPVHDAGVSATGQPFYVMRKIGGQPLEKLVGEAHTLPQRLALIPHIVASARAIAHAHERGIVHRDIKPSNILAGELGETIVIDWGLAKVIGEADELAEAAALASGGDPLRTRAGVVFGTPGFMSPEQLRGAPVDEQCDVYALGATLYHLLARRPPHYAKTADEMMRAAVTAPPTPVSELVEGVPPELETIVGKALAQTAEARYPSSRALAEDLQRFLTGQLVAAHRYSRKERIRRFVRLHRVELGIAALALVVMAVLSAAFIHRILSERDRADREADEARAQKQVADEQRIAATERADLLLLDRARALVATNPTSALAMITPLASSPRWWPQVRAIGAAARAAGLAYALPGSPHTQLLVLAHDGTHLLASGSDGVVRIHDLVARTTRVIAEAHLPVLARYSDDDLHVVIAAGTHVTIADTTGAPIRTLEAAAPIATLEVAGQTAYWVDTAHAGWALDVAAGDAVPAPLASSEPLRQIVPSPDNAWLAVIGADHLSVVDRSAPDAHTVALTEGQARAIAWSEDSSQFLALLDEQAYQVATGVPTRIVEKHDVGRSAAVAMVGDTPYVVGPTGVWIPTRHGNVARKQLAGYALGLAAGPVGAILAGSAQGTIAVLTATGDPILAVPSGGLTGFAAASQSMFVAGASDGSVLVWDLADVLPRPLTTAAPSAAELVDDDHVLAVYPYRAAQWIDLHKDTLDDVGDVSGASAIVAAPDGASAAVLDLAHQLRVVAPGHEPAAVAAEVSRAAYLADGRLAYATAGAVRLRDANGAHDTVLAPLPGGAGLLATRGRWIAAAYADGALWRIDTATGHADHVAAAGASPRAIALTPDGTLLVAIASDLRAWRATGGVVVLAQLPQPIRRLYAVPAGRVLALADTAAYAIELASPTAFLKIPLSGTAAVAEDAGLVIVRSSAGVLEVIDAFAGPAEGVRWTLASAPEVTFSTPRVTRDGRRVLASTPGGLVVWTLDLPATADATAAWLATLSTAAP